MSAVHCAGSVVTAVVASLGAAAIAPPGRADVIGQLVLRNVFSGVTTCPPEVGCVNDVDADATIDPGPWSAAVGAEGNGVQCSATQASSIGSLAWSLTGVASGSGGSVAGLWSSSSSAEVVFIVYEQVAMRVAGVLDGLATGAGAAGNGKVQLGGPGGTLFLESVSVLQFLPVDHETVDATIMLAPGLYNFEFDADADGDTTTSINGAATIAVDLDVTLEFVGCGRPGGGSCLAPHRGPGCESAACCEAVCDFDPPCCDASWDAACAKAAEAACPTVARSSGVVVDPCGGSAYVLLSPSSWADAEATAEILGGHLVTIDDATENAFIAAAFGDPNGAARSLWIGFNDQYTEGYFSWVAGVAPSFVNWARAEPDGGIDSDPQQDHAAMGPDGLWFDAPFDGGASAPIFGVVELPGGSGILGDLDGNGAVDGADLGALLGAWGAVGGLADLNCDGEVDGGDLGIVLGAWG